MLTPEDIELNDIIAFHSPYSWGTLIVHRVVEIRTLNDQLIPEEVQETAEETVVPEEEAVETGEEVPQVETDEETPQES